MQLLGPRNAGSSTKCRFGTQELQNSTQLNPLGFCTASLRGQEALRHAVRGEKHEVCGVVI